LKVPHKTISNVLPVRFSHFKLAKDALANSTVQGTPVSSCWISHSPRRGLTTWLDKDEKFTKGYVKDNIADMIDLG
jgi:hypothetical protein